VQYAITVARPQGQAPQAVAVPPAIIRAEALPPSGGATGRAWQLLKPAQPAFFSVMSHATASLLVVPTGVAPVREPLSHLGAAAAARNGQHVLHRGFETRSSAILKRVDNRALRGAFGDNTGGPGRQAQS
jgi:hypothetical protein